MEYKTESIDHYIHDIPDGIPAIKGAMYMVTEDPRDPSNGLKLVYLCQAASELDLTESDN